MNRVEQQDNHPGKQHNEQRRLQQTLTPTDSPPKT